MCVGYIHVQAFQLQENVPAFTDKAMNLPKQLGAMCV